MGLFDDEWEDEDTDPNAAKAKHEAMMSLRMAALKGDWTSAVYALDTATANGATSEQVKSALLDIPGASEPFLRQARHMAFCGTLGMRIFGDSDD